MVPADSCRITRAPHYSGIHYVSSSFGYRIITLYYWTFQNILLTFKVRYRDPTTPITHYYVIGLGFSPFARHYWGNHCLFSFPAGTKMFQFPAFAPIKNIWVTILQTVRLSHSEILGSKIICIYPRLIAAYHVLHRLREPRHPPYALNYFLFILYTTKLIIIVVAHSCSYFQLYFEI